MNHMLGRLGLVLLLGTACAGEAAQTCRDDIPATAPDSRFVDNGDGTVTDVATGLMWKQCLEGLSGAGCESGSVTTFIWQQALQRAADVAFAGYAEYTDWRLPNKNELESLVERRCSNPAINARFFPNTLANWIWSSSSYVGTPPNQAWGVATTAGRANYFGKSSAYYVRLVRAGH